jgi:hypothetical protein
MTFLGPKPEDEDVSRMTTDGLIAVQQISEEAATTVVLKENPADCLTAATSEPKASHHPHEPKTNRISKKEVLIWAPALATEPIAMLRDWIYKVEDADFDNIILVLNGPGSERVCLELRKEVRRSQVQIAWLSGSGSIGSCQTFVTHLFLQSKLRLLVRIDPDGQFRIKSIKRMLSRFAVTETARPDVIIAQRDQANIGGRMRFLGSVLLRMLAAYFANFADPNSGLYVLNRKAAVLL